MSKSNFYRKSKQRFLVFSTIVMAILLGLNVSCSKSDDDESKKTEEPAQTYPTDGLVSFFKFDDDLKDSNNKTPDGTNNGNATFIDGKTGKAITLNGTNQFITFSRKTFKNGNNISVSVWFKAVHGQLRYFMMCSDFGMFTKEGNAGMAISLPITNNASGQYTADTWTHLVGTYDGTNIKAYINGVLKETKLHAGNISDENRVLTIGKFDLELWKGSVDNLFIYSKVLTQEEVTKLYNYHK